MLEINPQEFDKIELLLNEYNESVALCNDFNGGLYEAVSKAINQFIKHSHTERKFVENKVAHAQSVLHKAIQLQVDDIFNLIDKRSEGRKPDKTSDALELWLSSWEELLLDVEGTVSLDDFSPKDFETKFIEPIPKLTIPPKKASAFYTSSDRIIIVQSSKNGSPWVNVTDEEFTHVRMAKKAVSYKHQKLTKKDDHIVFRCVELMVNGNSKHSRVWCDAVRSKDNVGKELRWKKHNGLAFIPKQTRKPTYMFPK